jgi:hypothetical protein
MSAFLPITQEDIANIKQAPKEGYPPPPQVGPYKLYDQEMFCVVSGYYVEGVWHKTKGACRSPTYIKVQGIPMCATHALMKLNEMLVERGVIE